MVRVRQRAQLTSVAQRPPCGHSGRCDILANIARRVHRRALLAPLLVALGAAKALAQGAVVITQAGEPSVLYRWATDRCEDEFIPDAPSRAFRRSDGQMALIAAHRENWLLVGRDFASLRPSCRAAIRSSEHRRSGTGNLWIEATYTHDGQYVAALVSQDLTENVRRAGCDKRNLPGRCWLNNIVAALSTDMGQSFSLQEPERRVVATLGTDYPPESRMRFGVFTTSNIVRGGAGSYYMIAYTQGEGVQQPGNCLFRTDDPFLPERWRGWDGSDFNVDLRPAASPRSCRPLGRAGLPTEVRSLTYDSRRKAWIAVFAARLKTRGDVEPVPGFYYSQSPDLLQWQAPQRIMRAPTRPRTDDPGVFMSYPSLLDPGSASRNFDTLESGNPVLLFTVHHLERGRGTMNRDLQYIPLRVE